MNVNRLENEVRNRSKGSDRFIIGIAGAPGAGKSTMAEALAERLNADNPKNAALVPMDGFHLDNDILNQNGWLNRKGAPHTFDAEGFLHTLSRIHEGQENVYVPIFDRAQDMAHAAAGCIFPKTRYIIVEGNYLLLKEKPWTKLKPLFDLTIFLQVDINELEQRFIARWLNFDYTREQAADKARSNDLPNAQYVIDNSSSADIVVANQ